MFNSWPEDRWYFVFQMLNTAFQSLSNESQTRNNNMIISYITDKYKNKLPLVEKVFYIQFT